MAFVQRAPTSVAVSGFIPDTPCMYDKFTDIEVVGGFNVRKYYIYIRAMFGHTPRL